MDGVTEQYVKGVLYDEIYGEYFHNVLESSWLRGIRKYFLKRHMKEKVFYAAYEKNGLGSAEDLLRDKEVCRLIDNRVEDRFIQYAKYADKHVHNKKGGRK